MSEYDIPGPEDIEPTPDVTPEPPRPGTGTVTISHTGDGWLAYWSDGEGRALASPELMSFPDSLDWARSKPAPEIHIFTGWWKDSHRLM